MVEPTLGVLDGPAFDIVDPEFATCIDESAKITRLWTGGRWAEGPAWLSDRQELVWSDIPNNRMLFWRATDATTGVFRAPSNGSNGNTVDREGRLITCEHASRRVTRTEPDGTVTVLASHFEGKRFNSPNDVVVRSDGTIWFTDPSYGPGPDYEGELELAGCHVYRLDPATGAVRQMTSDMVMPNGLAFSRDDTVLYVIDTGSTRVENGPNHIRRFSVGADDQLGGGEVLVENPDKAFDGLRIDISGRLWCGTGDGVRCYKPDGKLLGRVLLPERAANLTLVNAPTPMLFATATSSLYVVPIRAGVI